MKYYIGIDPGFTGAVAILNSSQDIVDILDTPTKQVPYKKKTRVAFVPSAMTDILRYYANVDTSVILEDVGAMSGQGVTSMFRFGHGLGLWEGILTALGIPYALVLPVKWKTHFGFINKDKEATLIYVREQKFHTDNDYFKLKKHHNRADAYCMARYGAETDKE